jgi:hypothetical protein
MTAMKTNLGFWMGNPFIGRFPIIHYMELNDDE